MENSEALVLFSELSRATVESRLKVLVQLLMTRYGPTHGLWKWQITHACSGGYPMDLFFTRNDFEFGTAPTGGAWSSSGAFLAALPRAMVSTVVSLVDSGCERSVTGARIVSICMI